MNAMHRTAQSLQDRARIAVVIPCFRVKAHIGEVIAGLGQEVDAIYVIDDACPEQTGAWVRAHLHDARLRVIEHDHNLGVGGAVMTGYRAALAEGFDIVVKIDGDGQMDPADLPRLVRPIVLGQADYCKGNRFFHPEDLSGMPLIRLLGNGALSLLSKLSTGYWQIFDPTNGYTAIHRLVVYRLPLQKISKRYFFETDMLFRLGLMNAKVTDIPMKSRYGNETSQLNALAVIPEFFFKHLRNFTKRVIYQYYLRDMSIASMQLPLGLAAMLSGAGFGLIKWRDAAQLHLESSAGTVMLAALPIIMGFQLLMSFLSFDISQQPQQALWPHLDAHDAQPPNRTA